MKFQNHMKISPFEKWFLTFLDEKNVDMSENVPCSNGTLQVGDVCTVILATTATEQAQIKKTLVQIDFKNGDVLHFIKFLALKLNTSHKVKS